MTLVLLVVSLVSVFLLWRLSRVSRSLRDLTHAIEDSQGILPGKPGVLTIDRRMHRLMAAVNRLISEHGRATEKGREYLNQIQATLGNLREAVVIIDDEQYIRLANDAFRELVGRPEPPVGRRLETFIQSSDLLEIVAEIRKGRGPGRRETEVRIGNRQAWLEISGARLPSHPRNPDSLTLFVLHDISRQKKLEKMRTDFVANVSHELRTPVTVIKGFAETLLDDLDHLDRAEQHRFLEKINTHSARLADLLQDLLLLSRLESTENMLNLKDVQLHRLLREIIDPFESRLDQGAQRIVFDLRADEAPLRLDPLRISQVVVNLLENVFRHARGFTTIRISTVSAPGGVLCTVEDDGAGIPPRDLPFIFQRFYRVDKGRSREQGGTGLGLSIIKHIIQQHLGDIKVESQPGKFTRFTFFLPNPEKMVSDSVLHNIRGRKLYFEDGE